MLHLHSLLNTVSGPYRQAFESLPLPRTASKGTAAKHPGTIWQHSRATASLPETLAKSLHSPAEQERDSRLLIDLPKELLQLLIEMQADGPRRAIARLYYLENIPRQEIARQLHMNEESVLAQLRRFRLLVNRTLIRFVDGETI